MKGLQSHSDIHQNLTNSANKKDFLKINRNDELQKRPSDIIYRSSDLLGHGHVTDLKLNN